MEGVIANTPSYSTFITCGRGLIGLTFNAQVHNVITANGTVVYYDTPSPQGYRVPFLHFKFLSSTLALASSRLLRLLLLLSRLGFSIFRHGGYALCCGEQELLQRQKAFLFSFCPWKFLSQHIFVEVRLWPEERKA
jgi:hypothetical protein